MEYKNHLNLGVHLPFYSSCSRVLPSAFGSYWWSNTYDEKKSWVPICFGMEWSTEIICTWMVVWYFGIWIPLLKQNGPPLEVSSRYESSHIFTIQKWPETMKIEEPQIIIMYTKLYMLTVVNAHVTPSDSCVDSKMGFRYRFCVCPILVHVDGC